MNAQVVECDHPLDAIKANEWNRCVQCHRCGHVFEWLDGEPWEYVAQSVTQSDEGARL